MPESQSQDHDLVVEFPKIFPENIVEATFSKWVNGTGLEKSARFIARSLDAIRDQFGVISTVTKIAVEGKYLVLYFKIIKDQSYSDISGEVYTIWENWIHSFFLTFNSMYSDASSGEGGTKGKNPTTPDSVEGINFFDDSEYLHRKRTRERQAGRSYYER